MKKRGWIYYGILIVLSVLFSVLLEVFLFHGNTLFFETYETKLNEDNTAIERFVKEKETKLSAEEENSILVSRENAKVLATLQGIEYREDEDATLLERSDGMYRKQQETIFEIRLPNSIYVQEIFIECLNKDMDKEVSVYTGFGEDKIPVGESFMDKRIAGASVKIKENVDEISVVFMAEGEVMTEAVKMQISNTSVFNKVRLSFFILCFFLVGFFVINIGWFEKKPEHIFGLCCLLLGSILIYAIGTNQIGYDEHIHMKKAYELSFGSTVLTTESAMQMEAATFPSFDTYAGRKQVEAYGETNHDFSWANITTQSRFTSYDLRPYYPIAVFMKIGRLLDMPFVWNMMFAKWGNLLCYTALVWLAIRLAKQGKVLVGALALLPNYLFAAASFTYDGILNGCFLLAVVLTMNRLLEAEEKMTAQKTFALLAIYIVGSLAKPIYILMAFVLVFLQKAKFYNRKREVIFKICVVAIGMLMIYGFFFPPVSASSNYEVMGNLAYAGDKRSQGTSVLGQISYILENPLQYTKLLLTSMIGEVFSYLSGKKPFLNYGYLGGMSLIWTWICLIFVGMAAVFAPRDEQRSGIETKYKLLNIIMILGMSAVIWTSMYVTFTAVGSDVINGVQGRYFLPLFLPFFFSLMGNRWKLPLENKYYAKLIFGALVGVNLYAIYFLAVIPKNW